MDDTHANHAGSLRAESIAHGHDAAHRRTEERTAGRGGLLRSLAGALLTCLALITGMAPGTRPAGALAGATISGTVTGPGGVLLEDTLVEVHYPGDAGYDLTFTDASGEYTITGLPPGDWEVSFDAYWSEDHTLVEWYDGVVARDDATAVTVTAGATVTGIDAALDLRPSSAPGKPTATAGVGQVRLGWNAPTEAGTASISDYVVQYSVAGADAWTTFNDGVSTDEYATVTGLTNGTAYEFRVAARNFGPTSDWSPTSDPATPSAKPGAPGAPDVVAGAGKVTLRWTATSDDGGAAITDYAVSRREWAGWFWSGWTDGVGTGSTRRSATVNGLKNGTRYQFQVAAVNQRGRGTWSSASPSVTPRTVPSAPGSPALTPGSTKVKLSWAASKSNGGAPIADYLVMFRKRGTSTWRVFGDGVSANRYATVTGLANGTSYEFCVRAKNVAGPGPVSGVARATPHA